MTGVGCSELGDYLLCKQSIALPSIFIFSETFHPLYFKSNTKSTVPKISLLHRVSRSASYTRFRAGLSNTEKRMGDRNSVLIF